MPTAEARGSSVKVPTSAAAHPARPAALATAAATRGARHGPRRTGRAVAPPRCESQERDNR
eukprot:124272-Pyramimonas_sp.AAC.1